MHFQNLNKAFLFLMLMLMGSLTMAQETFLDNFNTAAYSNNNGTMSFAADWQESGDNNDPTSGRFYINTGTNRLRIQDLDGASISRTLNLAGATGMALTMSYTEISGNEQIDVDLWNGTGWNTVATLNGSGTVNYNLAVNEMSASSQIRFVTNSGGWGSSEAYEIDNVQFSGNVPPSIVINDVSVNEDAGTATFTASHQGSSTTGPFTVNYQTVDGTALSGTHYTSTTGTLSFNGTTGDTEPITVPIIDNSLYDGDKDFTIQFTSVSDGSVDISDTATGTIVDDEVVLGDTPLTLVEEFDGYMDYASTGGSLRDQPNGTNACSTVTSSSNTLTSTIPVGATVERAILYWSNSGAMDPTVTFEGVQIDAELVYRTTIIGLEFHNHSADVTAMLQAMPDPTSNTFDFSGLTIDSSGSYCSSAVTLGGWALMVFYNAPGLPASTINLYQGFDGSQFATTSFGLSGFYAIGSTGAKTTILSWEGDQTLANTESLQFNTPLTGNNTLTGDGDNTTGTNPFNSTIYDNVGTPITNDATQYGVDLDTYDVSALILPGETSATTTVNVGQDFVMMNAVVLKVPSNIIVGVVYEDINYGGGFGRNQIASSGVGIPNATVELYDNLGALVFTTTTDAAGQYTFAGMVNGTFTARVVNSLVPSTRPNGNSCGTCVPIQTYKADYLGSTIIPDVNTVGGNTPSTTDPGAGTLAGAQSTATITIINEGAVGIDFGFNFNTIVNTNETGQGSLEQFIVNSNNLGETGLDIVANSIFDPTSGEDTSIFMIPTTGDPLGRTPDVNFASGYFDIFISNGAQLTELTSSNTIIDGRTQTAYSGDTNSGTIGLGASNVGISATVLPNYNLPEIQVRGDTREVFRNDGTLNTIRNLAIFLDDKSAIQVNDGSLNVFENLIGVNAMGVNTGDMEYGVEITDGTATISRNFLSGSNEAAIFVNGGTSTIIDYNHIYRNGTNDTCTDNILIQNGSGIVIRYNLINESAGVGIEGDDYAAGLLITENTITNNGINNSACGGGIFDDAGIRLKAANATISHNIIHSNQGEGVVVADNVSGILISRNSFYNNGQRAPSLGIDLDESKEMGDGVTLNDNGDGDNGPNALLNFPIISAAYQTPTNMVIEGWSRPGATIEIFLTDISEGSAIAGDNQLGFSTDYGEGQTFLTSVVEGSAADTDSGLSPYTDNDGNTDNTNKFRFSIALPPGVNLGDQITATSTISNSTSEFSPMSTLKAYTIITNRRITYRVNKN